MSDSDPSPSVHPVIRIALAELGLNFPALASNPAWAVVVLHRKWSVLLVDWWRGRDQNLLVSVAGVTAREWRARDLVQPVARVTTVMDGVLLQAKDEWGKC